MSPDTVLDALGEPGRRQLMVLLHERGESTVTALVDASGIRQPQVSKHLKVLSHAELVSVRPDGRRRYYRLRPNGLKAAHDWFGQFEDVWQDRFDALDALVSGPDPTPDVTGLDQSDPQPEPQSETPPDPDTTKDT
ncbi:ArsR/SmtB family transcription factor [Euzebya tangerina]|uniref:ArsR/SmtB family transcription factor n=1 Tax=Euzebya tangerina TaxID=591198 RepID=UPI000E30FC47|nr:metalloregulator ArsR/SmtB family transcription factor [Euzebya tangerina]